MNTSEKITVAALNVSAKPHPEGIYKKIIEHSANRELKLVSHDWAKITPPETYLNDANLLHGRICVWTEIEKRDEWFNKNTNSAASANEKEAILIPKALAPNYRYFLYCIDLKRHLIIFECKNELGHSFDPKRARRFFDNLFNTIEENSSEIDVTVIPEEDSIEKILLLPKLKRLKIVITRPNSEDLTDDFTKVLNELTDQNAKSSTIELNKAPKTESLKPNERNIKLAKIASTNGYVEGHSSNGTESTREHPKKIPVSLEGDVSHLVKFVRTLLHF